MITNETRAKLIGRSIYWGARFDGPFFDTDANAVAELRAFVRARGKHIRFIEKLETVLDLDDNYPWDASTVWDALDATPAQQCAAFDAVFKDDLEKL